MYFGVVCEMLCATIREITTGCGVDADWARRRL